MSEFFIVVSTKFILPSTSSELSLLNYCDGKVNEENSIINFISLHVKEGNEQKKMKTKDFLEFLKYI